MIVFFITFVMIILEIAGLLFLCCTLLRLSTPPPFCSARYKGRGELLHFKTGAPEEIATKGKLRGAYPGQKHPIGGHGSPNQTTFAMPLVPLI
jgi:hypothetical protein